MYQKTVIPDSLVKEKESIVQILSNLEKKLYEEQLKGRSQNKNVVSNLQAVSYTHLTLPTSDLV